jgi:hypothetical protein
MRYFILSLVLTGIALAQSQVPSSLSGVRVSNPTNGQCLLYNSTTQKWVNGSCGSGSPITNLNQISTRLFSDLQSKPNINTNGLLTGGGSLTGNLTLDCPNCSNKTGETFSGYHNFSSAQLSFPLAPLFTNLPSAVSNIHKVFVITDGNANCTAGGGTNRCLLASNGTAWTPYFSTATVSSLTDIPTRNFTDLQNIPTSFTPSVHTHTSSNITDFATAALSATSGAYSATNHTHVATNITNFNTAALSATASAYAPTVHTHVSTDITNFNTAVLSATSSTYAPINQSVCVQSNSSAVGCRSTVDLVPGTGVLHVVADTGTKITDTISIDSTVETKLNAQAGTARYCPGSASATAATCTTINPTPVALTKGMTFVWEIGSTNTSGAITLDVDSAGSLTPKAIKKNDGTTDPDPGSLVAGEFKTIFYDGTVFRLPKEGSASASTQSVDTASTITVDTNNGWNWNNSTGNITYNLPTITTTMANTAYRKCFANYPTRVGQITLQLPASTSAARDGSNGSVAGTVVSSGALGDGICVQAVTVGQYAIFPFAGVWSNN